MNGAGSAMLNKAVVITGATSGIGLETARLLAVSGFGIIGTGPDAKRCRAAREHILGAAPGADVRYIPADLMAQREVARFAAAVNQILGDEYDGSLYALINNAGCAQNYYATTEDGMEKQFALNYLCAFMLTHLLMPALIRGSGRVMVTSSASHRGINVHWDDVMLTRRYNPLTAYKQSKLCDMLLIKGIRDRYTTKGVSAYAIDPGLVKTDIGTKAGGIVKLVWALRKPFGVPAAQPAATYDWLCRQAVPPKELYYFRCKPRTYSRYVTSENADRLFALSHALCGTKEE